MAAILFLFTLFLAWVLYYASALYRNYRAARASGLPVLICLFNPENVIYMVTKGMLMPYFKLVLPLPLYDAVFVTGQGWEFKDKYEIHRRIGPVFMLVTPGLNELWVAHPEVAHSVLLRRKEFLQLDIAKLFMSLAGPNIITVSIWKTGALNLAYLFFVRPFLLDFFFSFPHLLNSVLSLICLAWIFASNVPNTDCL